MSELRKYLYACLFAIAAPLAGASPAWAQVSLGDASEFAVLGGSAVTCTDGSVVTGDVGISPGSAFTNTGCTIAGDVPPETNAAAADARDDFLSAYAAIQAMPCIPMGGNLSGQNLAPGVYCLDAVAKAGTLTLTGDANDVWIFRVDGALTGTNFTVVMAGGGQPCNVYWAPSDAATMTDSALKGNILAGGATLGSITSTRGTLAGRALANIAVTMTGTSVIGCDVLSDDLVCKPKKRHGHDKDKKHKKCNQGVGNGPEHCDPGHSNQGDDWRSNDEHGGKPGRQGGNR